MKILVVDDEEGMREGMRRILVKRGYAVRTAEDGSRAQSLLEQESFDLALVDLKMPGIDGFKLTENINERFGNRIVVVIVSALATVEAAVAVTRHGAFDFIVKPFTPQDLLQVVERAAGQKRLIEEREKYLVELSGERNLSRQLINSMQEGVIVLNLNGKPVLMNPRAEFLLGVGFREDLSVEELGLGEGIGEAVRKALDRTPAGGGYRLLDQQVGGVMLEASITPYVRNDEPGGAIVNLKDITERWRAEQDKNRFITMVAHELTSPLAAIINYINVIQSGMFDEKIGRIHEMLERSKIRGEALLDLINDLQYLNRRDAGRIERRREPLDLKVVLEEQLEFMKVQADRRAVDVVLHAAEGDYVLLADRGDLDRIFMNLISNGIKYNREGGSLDVTLRRVGKAEAAAAGGESVEVSIADSGIGMTPEEMKGLFQEFYRVKNRGTAGISGTGLGLATVKRILDSYNGTIRVTSDPGNGSVFTVTVPAGPRPR